MSTPDRQPPLLREIPLDQVEASAPSAVDETTRITARSIVDSIRSGGEAVLREYATGLDGLPPSAAAAAAMTMVVAASAAAVVARRTAAVVVAAMLAAAAAAVARVAAVSAEVGPARCRPPARAPRPPAATHLRRGK